MLTVHRAERADTLADALAEILRTPPADPFEAEIVAVPARGVERWLAQRLSRRLGAVTTDGIAANIAFPSLAALVESVSATPTPLGAEADPWSPARLAWPLLEVIDESVGQPWAGVLTRHLAGERAGRRYATALQLAELFRRYGSNRPAMTLRWADGADTDQEGRPLDADQRWQAELWRRVRARVAVVSPAERLVELDQRLRLIPDSADLPARLSVFGISRVTTEQLTVLGALAAGRDMHVWLPHPSPARWERLRSEPLAGPRRGGGSSSDFTHPLLGSLGRDGRELQARLMPLIDRDVHHPADGRSGVTPSRQGPSLLGQLQADLAADVAPAVAGPDRSLQIHSCHGPSRQVEALRDALLHLFQTDRSLEPRDVVVMCPDVDEYAPLIQAAFGGEASTSSHPAHALRVRLADRSLRRTNPQLDVVAVLLELADGRVTATELLDLAGRVAVRRRFAFSDEDLERLRRWAKDTQVRWGIGERQRAAFGLSGVRQNSWATALDRILLGVAADETDSQWLDLALPLDDVESSDIGLAGRLAELVDRLTAILARLQGRRPAREWTATLVWALELLTASEAADGWTDAQARRELAAATAAGGDVEIELSDARVMLAHCLRPRPTRANFRTGELTVCTMVPMRSVPHRVIALLGLDDEVFPRGTRADGEDILARDPLPGERDPRSEDRQLLLDAVVAAEEHLLIFYTGADPVTGATRPPSTPLGELIDVMTAMTDPGGAAVEPVVRRHPLQPFDDRNFRGPQPHSFDLAALAGARARAEAPAPRPGLAGIRLTPARGAVPGREPGPGDDVSLADLTDFVVHPVRAFLWQRLGLRLPGPDEDLRDALDPEIDGLTEFAIGEQMLADLRPGRPVVDLRHVEWLRARVPPLRLGATVLARIEATVAGLEAEIAPVRTGPAEVVDVVVTLPDGRRVTGTVPGAHDRTLVRASYARLAERHRLQTWVALLAVAGGGAEGPWRAVATGRGRQGRVAQSVLVAPPDAVERLQDLVRWRDEGLRGPLPVAPRASAQYAERRLRGANVDDALAGAESEWSRRFGESEDRWLRYVHGESARLSRLTAEPADRPDGREAPNGEVTRFGILATRLWHPLLRAETLTQR